MIFGCHSPGPLQDHVLPFGRSFPLVADPLLRPSLPSGHSQGACTTPGAMLLRRCRSMSSPLWPTHRTAPGIRRRLVQRTTRSIHREPVTANKRMPCGFRYPPGEQRPSFADRCRKSKSFKGQGLQIRCKDPYKNLTDPLYYDSRTLFCGCWLCQLWLYRRLQEVSDVGASS
jgi:hypothetical protein